MTKIYTEEECQALILATLIAASEAVNTSDYWDFVAKSAIAEFRSKILALASEDAKTALEKLITDECIKQKQELLDDVAKLLYPFNYSTKEDRPESWELVDSVLENRYYTILKMKDAVT